MSWEKAIEELRRRERLAEHMGGEEPVERQRGRGKLTVRERVAFLADPGSFHEIGKIAGKAREKFQQIDAASATPVFPGQNKKVYGSSGGRGRSLICIR